MRRLITIHTSPGFILLGPAMILCLPPNEADTGKPSLYFSDDSLEISAPLLQVTNDIILLSIRMV